MSEMLIVLALALAALALVAWLAPETVDWFHGMSPQELLYVAAYGAFASMVAASLLSRYRGRIATGVRDAMLWCLIFGAVIVAYAYRDTFQPVIDRVSAELNPGSVMTPSADQAIVVRRRDGQFLVDAVVNGKKLPFVFDTGASTVVLRAEDAARVGVASEKLVYASTVSTANGRTTAAEATIDLIEIGGINERNVRALVTKPGVLNENLLGQTFLERLASYSVENNRLVLKGR